MRVISFDNLCDLTLELLNKSSEVRFVVSWEEFFSFLTSKVTGISCAYKMVIS
jgi:hypothetical protein